MNKTGCLFLLLLQKQHVVGKTFRGNQVECHLRRFIGMVKVVNRLKTHENG